MGWIISSGDYAVPQYLSFKMVQALPSPGAKADHVQYGQADRLLWPGVNMG